MKAKEEIITRVIATRAKVEKNGMYEKNTHTHTHRAKTAGRLLAATGRKERGARRGGRKGEYTGWRIRHNNYRGLSSSYAAATGGCARARCARTNRSG